MNWDFEKIISYLAAIGFGSILGLIVKYFLERRENQKKMLFDARIRAYTGLVGRLFNLFNEIDINNLEEALRVAKINHLLSEAYLIGSHDFVELVGEFKPVLFDFHNELDEIVKNSKKDETRLSDLHQELTQKIGLIYNQMRRDLFIDKVVFSHSGYISSNSMLLLRGLTKDEIQIRHSQSVNEIEEVQKSVLKSENHDMDVVLENITIPKNDYDKVLPVIESKALDKVEKSLGNKIKRQVGFVGLGTLRFDGLYIDNEKKIMRLYEVKIFPSLPRNKHGKVMVYAIAESVLKFLNSLLPMFISYFKDKGDWEYILSVIIVINAKSDFIRIRKKIEKVKEKININSKNLYINFIFYNLNNVDFDLEEETE